MNENITIVDYFVIIEMYISKCVMSKKDTIETNNERVRNLLLKNLSIWNTKCACVCPIGQLKIELRKNIKLLNIYNR